MNYKSPLFVVLNGLLPFRRKYFSQVFARRLFSSLYVRDQKPVNDS